MKNLVFLCDGTANELAPHPTIGKKNPATNVGHLYRRLSQSADQVARYEPGVGTFSAFGVNNAGWIGVWMGKLFGYGLDENMANGYRFLMEHYEPGDRIFLFGFSRGAYAVRALSGMLETCGLLERRHAHRLREVAQLYAHKDRHEEAAIFREHFSQDVTVHFMGVWDTVDSLGYLYQNRKFFTGELSPIVTHGYHALAIDEKRPKFEPLLWDESRIRPHQTIVQTWFRGAHADVGGGYKDRRLAEVSLQWMSDHAEREGLDLKPGVAVPQPPDPSAPIHRPWLSFGGRILQLLHLGNRPRVVPEGAESRPSVAPTGVAES